MHLVLRGRLRIVVHVQLHDARSSRSPCDLLEERGHDAAGAAPRRPEVDEHGGSASSTSASKFASVTSVIDQPLRLLRSSVCSKFLPSQRIRYFMTYSPPCPAVRSAGTIHIASSTIRAGHLRAVPRAGRGRRSGTSRTLNPPLGAPVGQLDLEGVAVGVDARARSMRLQHPPAEALEAAGEVADRHAEHGARVPGAAAAHEPPHAAPVAHPAAGHVARARARGRRPSPPRSGAAGPPGRARSRRPSRARGRRPPPAPRSKPAR